MGLGLGCGSKVLFLLDFGFRVWDFKAVGFQGVGSRDYGYGVIVLEGGLLPTTFMRSLMRDV